MSHIRNMLFARASIPGAVRVGNAFDAHLLVSLPTILNK